MAQIIWKPRAIRQLNAIIDYSVPEFGMVAFKRMDKRIKEIRDFSGIVYHRTFVEE